MISMTPKEKAKELFDKYLFKLSLNAPKVSDYLVKECALIAVDEIIEEIREFCDDNFINDRLHYWEVVKQELEKL